MTEPDVPESAEVEREPYVRELRAAMRDLAGEQRPPHELIDLRAIIAELDADD